MHTEEDGVKCGTQKYLMEIRIDRVKIVRANIGFIAYYRAAVHNNMIMMP